MADFYGRMAATALRLITRFGQAATLDDVTPGTYDPVTGETTGATPITQPCQVILLDYSLQESGIKYAEGSQVQAGDKKILIAAQGLAWAPMLTTTITADGAIWRTINIKSSNPAGTPLVYEIHGRK